MALKIKPLALGELPVYTVGGYKPDSTADRAAGIPIASDDIYDTTYVPTDINKHFRVGINRLSFVVEDRFRDPLTKELWFDLPGPTENILYLPYHHNCITSIVIPATLLDKSVCYFITAAMSGCNFFIDQRTNGDLVCYHANAKELSPKEELVKENPAATSEEGENAMATMHKNAQESECPEVARHRRLQASEYYAVPKAEVERERKKPKSRTNVEFFGGANVMGFRGVEGRWEFWFQTYGRITCDKVGTGAAPYKVFEARPFWAES